MIITRLATNIDRLRTAKNLRKSTTTLLHAGQYTAQIEFNEHFELVLSTDELVDTLSRLQIPSSVLGAQGRKRYKTSFYSTLEMAKLVC